MTKKHCDKAKKVVCCQSEISSKKSSQLKSIAINK